MPVDELLDAEDPRAMILSQLDERVRAIVAVLYESGFRAVEFSGGGRGTSGGATSTMSAYF